MQAEQLKKPKIQKKVQKMNSDDQNSITQLK